jgi:hypothetical protein
MKPENKLANFFLAVVALLALSPLLLLASCGHSFPYQGSIAGNWSGDLTILSRAIPVGGTISIKTDADGVVSGTVSSTRGGANPATISGRVDQNGNLTGTVSLTLGTTNFMSNWQAKMTSSGNSLGLQGTWTSAHGSGTFSGTGTASK